MAELHTNSATVTHVLTLYLLLGLCVIGGVVLSTVNLTSRRLKPRDDNASDLQFMKRLFKNQIMPIYMFARTTKAESYNRKTQKLRFDLRKIVNESEVLQKVDLHFYYPGCEEVNCSEGRRKVKLQLRQIGRHKCDVEGPNNVLLSGRWISRCSCRWAVFTIPKSKWTFEEECFAKKFILIIHRQNWLAMDTSSTGAAVDYHS
ncbi:hypothetical protein P879_07626 [Paragonimus westermani]|uniref:Uncharacterized protein n=1 Tax=Paragonimus westermani TaxID=34504 RepID=A0A8T0DIB7_9TREM|nr:hypothetical protein P879_07626 [Paragonimus westermani]